MIKAIQVYSYMVPYIPSFLASIRMLVGLHNQHFSAEHHIISHNIKDGKMFGSRSGSRVKYSPFWFLHSVIK